MVRPADPTDPGSWGFDCWGGVVVTMPKERIVAFVDGFNLYHAIDGINADHLKWVDLWKLCNQFVKRRSQKLQAVYYFSAYADWLPAAKRRHQEYVNALVAIGVDPIMAKFKDKTRKCPSCKHVWTGHEEKETDVNIALALIDGAYQEEFDRAFIVSRDSDLAPPLRMIRARFPKIGLTLLAPPNRGHSNEMLAVSPAPEKARIKKQHLDRCLLPQFVQDRGGNVAAIRPQKYDPPA